jgi:hypothetical protein
MAMQWSDAVKALRTKTAGIAVVKRGSTMLFAKRSKRSANEKIVLGNACFGSCHWQPQRVESMLGEQTEAVSQSEVCGFRDGSMENQPG